MDFEAFPIVILCHIDYLWTSGDVPHHIRQLFGSLETLHFLGHLGQVVRGASESTIFQNLITKNTSYNLISLIPILNLFCRAKRALSECVKAAVRGISYRFHFQTQRFSLFTFYTAKFWIFQQMIG